MLIEIDTSEITGDDVHEPIDGSIIPQVFVFQLVQLRVQEVSQLDLLVNW